MRDSHRLKEKYEISLDSRQIVSLTVAVLVVLGGVFVVGVMVGKRLAVEPKPAPQADLLSTLDQKAKGDEPAPHTDASLTFQDELTKKKAPEAAPAPVADAATRIAEAIEAAAAKPDAGAPLPKVVEVRLPDPPR